MAVVAAARSHTELTGPLCLPSLKPARCQRDFSPRLNRVSKMSFRSRDLSPPGLGPVFEPTAFQGQPWAPSRARYTFSERPAVLAQPRSKEKQGASCVPTEQVTALHRVACSPVLRVTVQKGLWAPVDRAFAFFPGAGEMQGSGCWRRSGALRSRGSQSSSNCSQAPLLGPGTLSGKMNGTRQGLLIPAAPPGHNHS